MNTNVSQAESAQAIAEHAEASARHWAQHPNEDCPACPWPQDSEARKRWNAALQRYLLAYSACCTDHEGSA
jgi:hypothetical protein